MSSLELSKPESSRCLDEDLDKTAQLYWNNMGGLTTEERADLDGILNPEGDKSARFVDVWRNHHPTAEEYTWVFFFNRKGFPSAAEYLNQA